MQNEQNSVMAVFGAVADHGDLSRAQLSVMTGFSQVTVGKAVDMLEKCGIITQRKQSSGAVGRKMSVCALDKSGGILLYDLTKSRPRVRVCDLSLNVCGEYEAQTYDIDELMGEGFGYFFETFGGELLGIGCVVPDRMSTKFAYDIEAKLNTSSEYIVRSKRAHAAANAQRFDGVGMTAFVRSFASGSADCTLMQNGRLYTGAHGYAGGLSRLIGSKDELAARLAELCIFLDPAMIHIACENGEDCAGLYEKIGAELAAYGIHAELHPEIIAEPMELCRTALDGTALLLRDKIVLRKIENNS